MGNTVFKLIICLFLLSANILIGFIYFEIRSRIIGLDDFTVMSAEERQEAAKRIPFVKIHSGSMAVNVINTNAIPVQVEH